MTPVFQKLQITEGYYTTGIKKKWRHRKVNRYLVTVDGIEKLVTFKELKKIIKENK